LKKFKFSHEDEETDLDYDKPVEESPFDPFINEGLIERVLYMVKSGKEATVYACKGGESGYLAVKVYLSRQHRNFKNTSVYREGRVILNGHDARAAKKKTEWGKKVQDGLWTMYELEFLKALYRVGADVPKPYVQRGNAILMEFVGNHEGPSPILNNVVLEDGEARPLFDQVIRNIELFLKHNLVHGDLSSFNILYHEGRIKIIDFPQAVDPRFNSNAYNLLSRDIQNVYRYFERYGVEADPVRIADRLWHRFKNSKL
jgi:RIO kinase 1